MDYKSVYEGKNFGIILFDEPLKLHTNFGIGGPCDVFVEPSKEDELINLIKFNKENNIETTIIGNGTNILVTDKGIRGCVIALSNNYDNIEIKEDHLIVTSGTLLSKASKLSFKNELTGMEEVSGIPGTIGGAVAMNAGAYGREMKDIIESVRLIDRSGNIVELSNQEMDFSYRHSKVFDDDLIVSSASFRLKKGNPEDINEAYKDFTYRRTSKQPLEKKSAGSTFKRPVGSFASKLIDESGLRGYSRGDCQVSEKHCGFIINNGDASFEEMDNFIKEIASIVKEKTGFILEREVKILGDL
ncbi:UDP-N-acetylmuramate dehydrogenase [Anaerococcus sp. AGMB00486]|uniref:UDP-N-acetylenolpyruvoylglucosamine reductase n=2 Tax=Anaerococcus TaxID=165779 RepID=A0ABX2N8L5_9FIRM|nr:MULTISPECIES: UDP-N-acetylmuramate dehydrogenase [Anaerococcus]MDY3006176.1 UDP-N-acetylmuramate dehydrogenase [Anaerococcus porci]MSS77150.1 UDP-N-acetylmuramate dehydrogenase [Anaerococcus porci]NVF11046.1 UDP-N-acetylmuramate dehydrogenase [Anaerococcus faecalis]